MSMQSPVSAIYWPSWRSPAVLAIRAMLAELEGLPITGGESSVRVSPQGVAGGRWLAGFAPAGVSSERLMKLPERLGMPAAGAAQFHAGWRSARQIYLAVEQTDWRVMAKVYLEHALPAPDTRTRAPAQRQVALSIESCKWCVDGPPVAPRHTEYWRLSGLDGAAMVALLNEGEDLQSNARPLYAGVAQVLAKALREAPDWYGYRLLLVREPRTTSHGIGVRFYGSALRANEVLEPLATVFQAWKLSLSQLATPMSVWASQELGWLHAGLDADGQPYLNVYGALHSADTLSVLNRNGATLKEPRFTLPVS